MALGNNWLRRRFHGEHKERTLGSSVKTLRSPKARGELSRFKLKRKYRRCRHNIYMETQHTDQAVFVAERLRQI